MTKNSWRRRATRWLALALAAFLAVTVLPVVALRWVDPWSSAFMLSARVDAWRARDQQYKTQYEWVDLERISPHAAMAVIAAEDQQFPFHAGFDFKSIREAIRSNHRSKRVRGASTISQQVAKNLFLWSGRSYVRKGLEAYFTVLIEWLWPKERILEVYLNIAEFGPGIYGVEAAANKFYRKPATSLSRRESATLAAVLPNPRKFKVQSPSRYVTQRRDWIMRQMRGLGGKAYLNQLDDDDAPRSQPARSTH
jgi:monofunctional biosynthetic peptidoglycan transglycosylase